MKPNFFDKAVGLIAGDCTYDADGKTILLFAEQGLGDTIQFVRYVEEVAKFNGNIINGFSAAISDIRLYSYPLPKIQIFN